MTTNYKEPVFRIPSDPIWYSDFAEPVAEMRHQLHRFIEKDLLNRDAYHAHEERRWHTSYGSCCYYFPYWIAEALDYRLDAPEVRSAASGNFFLYHYYTLRDDALDEGSMRSELAAFGGDLFLAHSLWSFAKTGVAPDVLMSQFARCLTVAVNAERKLREIGSIAPIGRFDVELSGQKAALAKVAAFALAITPSQRRNLTALEHAMDKLAVALQLIDDLLDWREDFECSRFTLPIVQALVTADAPSTPEGSQLVGQEIFSNGVADSTLLVVSNYLGEARLALPTSANYFRLFIDRLQGEVRGGRAVLVNDTVPWTERERRLRTYLADGGT